MILTYGPDLSHYEPGADWHAVASDNGFGITKATEGTSGVDSLFKSYWQAMGDAGLIRGAYHFFHPNMDPILQAKHFLSVVGPLKAYDFLALDWETTGGVSSANQKAAADKFFDYVDAQTKRKCWFYSYTSFCTENALAKYSVRPSWLAQYSARLKLPQGFKAAQIWQYTDHGKYKGVPHPCDGNIFFGSVDDMKSYLDSVKA